MKKTTSPESEVDELLKAVQDEMLLGLAVNSHASRVAPDYLRSDLDQRFRALKKPSSSSSSSSSTQSPMPKNPPPVSSDADSTIDAPIPKTTPPDSSAVDSELVAVLGGDLAARFAALKTTLPGTETATIPAAAWGGDDQESEDEDDEVEKLIRWAKDAARLDPSPPSDDELELDEDEDDEYLSPRK